MTIIRPPGNQPARGERVTLLFSRRCTYSELGRANIGYAFRLETGVAGKVGLTEPLVLFDCYSPVLISQVGVAEEKTCVPFLEALASGWSGLAMLKVSFGGLSDGWVSG